MKIPACSGWSAPQIGQSLAESATSYERGTSGSLPCIEPPSSTRHLPTQSAIQLSMIVEITSWAPTAALRKPAIPAQTAPPRMAPTQQRRTWSGRGIPTKTWPR